MALVRCVAGLLFLAFLGACTGVEEGASVSRIDSARHVSEAAPYVAVVSMVKRSNNRAAHTALFINASQQVIYDPAGSFDHPEMPERGDILYGANDRLLNYYERYHARSRYFVHVQKLPVSGATAEAMLRRAQAQGPSPKLFCTAHTIDVMKDVAGFEGLSRSFFPEDLRRQIAGYPNVRDRYLYEEDHGKNVPQDG